MPSPRVSKSETAPRTTGQPRGLKRRVTEAKGRSRKASVPSGRRTATAMREGERIMTPSMTAWPPTGRNGMGPPDARTAPGRRWTGREPNAGRYCPAVSGFSGASAGAPGWP